MFAISALLVGAVATVGFCCIGSSASEVTQAQTSNAELEVEEDRPDEQHRFLEVEEVTSDEQHRFLEVEEVTSDSTPPPPDDDDSTPPPSDDEKSQVGGTIKMSVSPAVLEDPAAKKALTESVAGEVAGRLNVSLEAVSVELEVSGSRRLADGATKAVTVKYTVDVPPGADASQMASTMEAVEPATLTATFNQAVSEVNPEYEVVVEAITAIEVIPSTTSVPSATSTTQEPAPPGVDTTEEPATNAAAPRGASALLLAASAGALAAAAASRLAW